LNGYACSIYIQQILMMARLWIVSCVIAIITLLILVEMDHSWSHKKKKCNHVYYMGDELDYYISLYY